MADLKVKREWKCIWIGNGVCFYLRKEREWLREFVGGEGLSRNAGFEKCERQKENGEESETRGAALNGIKDQTSLCIHSHHVTTLGCVHCPNPKWVGPLSPSIITVRYIAIGRQFLRWISFIARIIWTYVVSTVKYIKI